MLGGIVINGSGVDEMKKYFVTLNCGHARVLSAIAVNSGIAHCSQCNFMTKIAIIEHEMQTPQKRL